MSPRWLSRASTLDLTRTAGLIGLAALVPLSDLFYFRPEIDLAVARWVYADDTGFPLAGVAALQNLRAYGFFVFEVTLGLALAGLVAPFLTGGRRLPVPSGWCLTFSMSTLLGPGLVVNGILKEWSGRPRPRNVAEFGGGEAFARAWDFSGSCLSNCSFVSGEGAMAAMLLAVVLLVPPRWRGAALAILLPFSLAVASARIAFGGHFLSDVLISWCLTLMVIAIVQELVSRFGFDRDDARLARGFGQAGRWSADRLATLGRRLRL